MSVRRRARERPPVANRQPAQRSRTPSAPAFERPGGHDGLTDLLLDLQRQAGNSAVSAMLTPVAQRSSPPATETPDQALALLPAALDRYQQAVDSGDESQVRAVGGEVLTIWQRVELARLGQTGDAAADEHYEQARKSVLAAIPAQRYRGQSVIADQAAPQTWTGALADLIKEQVDETAWVVKDAAAAVGDLQREPLDEATAWDVVGLIRQHPNPWHFAFMLAVIRGAGQDGKLTHLPPGPTAALEDLRANQPALRAIPGIAPGDPVAKLALAPEENVVQLVQPLSPVEVATELYGEGSPWREVLLPLNRTALSSASDGGWLTAGTRLFVSPEALKPAYRIIFLAAASARQQTEKTKAEPVIRASIDGPIVPGNDIKLSITWPNSMFGPTPIEWYVDNDPSAVKTGAVPARVQGPTGTLTWGGHDENTSWEPQASAVGNHVIHCKLTPSGGAPIDVTRTVIVMTPEERLDLQQRANTGFDRSPNDLLQDLQQRLEATTDETAKAEIQKRIDGIKGILKDERAIDMRPLQGSYVSTDDKAASVPLRIYADIDRTQAMGTSTTYLKLWDLTLNGLPRNYTASGSSATEALRNLIATFADQAPYPKGKVRVAIPDAALAFPDVHATSVDAETHGGMLIDKVLQGASLVAAGIGVGAALFGQAEVAIPAFVISTALAGTASALDIADRLEHGDFEWDLNTAMDLLNIAAALLTMGTAGGVTAAARGVGTLRVLGTLNTAVGVTQIAVQTGVHLAAISAAIKSGDRDRIVTALTQALAAGALFLIIHKATASLGGSVDDALGAAAGMRTPTGELDATGLAKLMSSLPDVPTDQAALRAFTAEAVGLAPEQVTLVPIAGGVPGEGVSGAPVWLVKGPDQQIVAALKIFPKTTEFAQELSSLEKLNSIQLESGKGVTPKGVARTTFGSGQAGVLVSSAAEGQALNRMMDAAAKASGPERTRAFADLKAAVTANGRALSELHSVGPGGKVSPAYVERHVHAALDISANLQAYSEQLAAVGVDAASIRPKVEELATGFRAHPGSGAFVHGDAHPGNFFYDPASGITMIDTPTLHFSIDAEGHPIGAAGRDIGNFGQKLAHFGGRYGLLPDEIAQLQAAFRSGYEEAGSGPSTPEADAFFRARTSLGEVLADLKDRPTNQAELRRQADILRGTLGLPATDAH